MPVDEHRVGSLRDVDLTVIIWESVVFVMPFNCIVLYCQVYLYQKGRAKQQNRHHTNILN